MVEIETRARAGNRRSLACRDAALTPEESHLRDARRRAKSNPDPAESPLNPAPPTASRLLRFLLILAVALTLVACKSSHVRTTKDFKDTFKLGGKTIVMVSHDLELAGQYALDALCLDRSVCF
mgnify:CR=1 FL=1